jgi:membrane-bound metal-dependent hydrolase YbcI (DUF457 family)
MPFAVTHVLIPLILVDLIRDHLLKIKKTLPNKYVFISGLAGGLLDADLLLYYVASILGMKLSTHRIFFHNVWIPLFSLLAYILLHNRRKKNLAKIFLMIFAGTSIHLILDGTVCNQIIPFYPLDDTMVGLNLLPISPGLEPAILMRNLHILLSIDAIILILWLIHEELEHKISDFL